MMDNEMQREADRINALDPAEYKAELEDDIPRWRAMLERIKDTDPEKVKADWIAGLEATDPAIFKAEKIEEAESRDPDDFKAEHIARLEAVIRGLSNELEESP